MKNIMKHFLCYIIVISLCMSCLPTFAFEVSENGTAVENTFRDGILTAADSGSGIFALAVYKGYELISIEFVKSEEELENVKLNTIIENGSNKKVKLFRFNEDLSPIDGGYKELEYDSSADVRIYVNEDFSEGGLFVETDHKAVSDGRLVMIADADNQPRYGFGAWNPGRYLIYEADYSIPEGATPKASRLVHIYHTNALGAKNSIKLLILTDSKGQIYCNDYKKPNGDRYKFDTLSSTPIRIKLVIDLQENKYDFYIRDELKAANQTFYPSDSQTLQDRYKAVSFFTGYASSDKDEMYHGTLYVDNIKVYEGPDFKDIGNRVPNAHKTDYSDMSPNWADSAAEIYDRPLALEIAKKTLATPHPRIILDEDKLNYIKTSSDANVIEWTQIAMDNADAALSKSVYDYSEKYGGLQNLSESRNRMMNLGLAYLLTRDTKYSDRAYQEAQAMFNLKGIEGDDWNNSSCLDVTEVSQILAICYDWMYDAWTPEQKNEFVTHVMAKGIDNMYRNYYGMYLPSPANGNWWQINNNQGGVCNGSAIVTAIAFMEEDVHRCSEIVESGIRALEFVLENFAPDGGWIESASYWAYTLNFVTAAAATLDTVCGTNYGLQDTIGLEKGCFYSLAIEGETGSLSFGDAGAYVTNAPFLFYWAEAYKNKDIGSASMYSINKSNRSIKVFDLIYYNPDYIGESITLPEEYYYRGPELVSLRSGSGEGETYIVMSGGKGHLTGHDHLDSGHFILEMDGERVLKDMGAENYSALGYFDSYRYLYFRARTEAHNIFIINPEKNPTSYPGQDKAAFSEVTSYSAEDKSATMDLSAAYARDAKEASRKIALDGKDLIVEDKIVLSDASNDVYWNWYVTSHNVDDNGAISKVQTGFINISEDKKSAVITRNDKKFLISFEANCDYVLAVEAAEAYVNTTPASNTHPLHSNASSIRLVVKMEGVGGTLNLKTTVKRIQ